MEFNCINCHNRCCTCQGCTMQTASDGTTCCSLCIHDKETQLKIEKNRVNLTRYAQFQKPLPGNFRRIR